MITAEAVEKALMSLGDEADMIAQSLHAMGIRMQVDTEDICRICPIALFLQQTFNEPTFRVGMITCWVEKNEDTRYSLPYSVRDFVHLFGIHHYPSLRAN